MIFTYILYFFFYSAVGWLMESLACSSAQKRWINRGFLTGPMCPIYGTGAVALSVLLTPLRAHPLLVCILGMVITDVVELITGILMEKLFHTRWWDYSNRKYNFMGHICLRNTLYWGIATLGFMYLVHPFFALLLGKIPPLAIKIIVILILIIFVLDLIHAFLAAADFRKISDALQKLYDKFKSGEEQEESKELFENTLEDIRDSKKYQHNPGRILRINPRIDNEIRRILRDIKRILSDQDERY